MLGRKKKIERKENIIKTMYFLRENREKIQLLKTRIQKEKKNLSLSLQFKLYVKQTIRRKNSERKV